MFEVKSIDFDKKGFKELEKYIQQFHPFCMFSPNVVEAGRTLTSSDWLLLMEISTRLTFNQGTFILVNDSELQKKLKKVSGEINLSISRLIKAEIISIIDSGIDLYQANPVILWKGNQQTLLDKHNELLPLSTFTLKDRFQNAANLTSNRVLKSIREGQQLLNPCIERNDRGLLDLPGEEWVPLLENEDQYTISNKGRVKYTNGKGIRILEIKKGLVKVRAKFYVVAKLLKEHFPEEYL